MNKMIDLHNHILPMVDDGSRDIDEAIESIKYLKSRGITDIVLTSHYIVDTSYCKTVSEREKILDELNKQIDNDTNLYLGNEVYAADYKTLLSLLKENKITTLNKSKYLLIEFPMDQVLNRVDLLLCELNANGIIPIIAHPERYSIYKKHPEKIYELFEYNCLLQCNLGSISGQYGKQAKKCVKWLLKHDLVFALATDYHHIGKKDYISKAFKKLKWVISKNKIEELTYINPKKVLDNK